MRVKIKSFSQGFTHQSTSKYLPFLTADCLTFTLHHFPFKAYKFSTKIFKEAF